jgi:hypothetical protein
MEPAFPISYVLLVIAIVGIVVLYLAWGRRSRPTETRPEDEPRQPLPGRDSNEAP